MRKVYAVHINDLDTCVTVTEAVQAGDTVEYRLGDGSTASVTALGDAPIYHKIAIADVPKGQYVYKYGEKIGVASQDIHKGDYVHTHNLKPVGHLQEV
jgi:altronate dehydratase small subunit